MKSLKIQFSLLFILAFNQFVIVNAQEIIEQVPAIKKHKPLTTDRMYHPDSIIKSGRWGAAVNIRETKSFNKFTTEYMEPGIKWTNGMFTTPGNAPTEMIYYHNGSKAYLSGYVSVLDCIDYCGSIGDCGFIIVGDGKELWKSKVIKQHDKPVEFNISLKGVKELRLIVNSGGDNIDEDWGCWMDMKISKKIGKSYIVKEKSNDDNILINGSFEDGFSPGTFKTLKAGDKILGWTVTKATVDLSGNYIKAEDGKNSIDLNGTPGFGGIQQRFFTKKGKKYLLSFYLAGNPAGGPTIKKLLVSFGDQTVELEFDITGKTTQNMGWKYIELVFKAKERATILKFESNHLSGPASWGPAIDNVKLVPYHKSKHHNILNKKSTPLFGFKTGILGGISNYFVSDDDIQRLTDANTSLYNLKVNGKTLGFHAGIMTQVRIWRLLLRPEFILNYNSINFQVEDLINSSNDTIVKESYEFMNIPVMLGYKHKKFRFMVGPVGHIFIANQSNLKDIFNFTKDFKRFTLGFQAGIGFDIDNFGIDLRYEGSGRGLGSGLKFSSGEKVYFAETPSKIVVSLSYVIK